MPTIDLGVAAATPTPPTGPLAALPRRVGLTLPELLVVAERAGGAPLPFELRDGDEAVSALGGRLGRTPAEADAAAYAAALGALHDPEGSLRRRGLLGPDADDEALLGAVGLLATPRVALDLDVTAGGTRVRAWHRERAGAVAALATADGIVFELAWFATEQWSDELGRVAVVPPDLAGVPTGVPARVDLPYGLLDAAAEAVRSGRADLLSVLVTEHAGQCRDGAGDPVDDLEVVALLGALTTECRGRLRGMLADVSRESTDAVGVVSWVLLGDGWHALRPQATPDGERVSVVGVRPADLGAELAPVLAEVVR